MVVDRQIAVFTTLLAVATTIVAGATPLTVPLCFLMDHCEPGVVPDPAEVCPRVPRPTSGPRAGIAPPMPFIDPSQVRNINLDGPDGEDRVYSILTGCSSGQFLQGRDRRRQGGIAVRRLLDFVIR